MGSVWTDCVIKQVQASNGVHCHAAGMHSFKRHLEEKLWLQAAGQAFPTPIYLAGLQLLLFTNQHPGHELQPTAGTQSHSIAYCSSCLAYKQHSSTIHQPRSPWRRSP
jgi:hypothetical protein